MSPLLSKTAFKKLLFFFVFVVFTGAYASAQATAGIFDLASFVEPNNWSFGVEPEIIISNPAGAGINFKPRYGINNHINVQGIIGSGTPQRGFRIGGTGHFEFFPDFDMQPGVALPVTLLYSRIGLNGQLSMNATPMVYKTFRGKSADFTPFVGAPLGWYVLNWQMNYFAQASAGCLFKVPVTPTIKYTLEAGFNIVNAYSYISGGISYFLN